MYLVDEPKIVPFANFSDTGEPMTLYIYPPYRSGLREADGEESPRDGTESPSPVPPSDERGDRAPSTELEVRSRSSDTIEVPLATTTPQSSSEDTPRDSADNVRNVNFNDKPSNFEGARRIRQEQMDAERKQWQEANERLRQEAEARARESERIRKESERIAEAGRQKIDDMLNDFREAHVGAGSNPSQQNASSIPSQQAKQGTQPQRNKGPSKNETPEHRRRRIDQEDGVKARRNGAPIAQEIQLTDVYKEAMADRARAKRLFDLAVRGHEDAIKNGDNRFKIQEMQNRVNAANASRRAATDRLKMMINGRDKEANAEVIAARKNRDVPESAETKTAA